MTQDRLGAFRGAILLDQIEAGQRDVEARGFGEFEQHEFGGAIAVVDFLQALILADAMLDVDDVVSDLEVAEVGEEGGDFGFGSLRTRGDCVGFVEEIARAEDGEIRFGQQDAIGDVGRGERGGEDFAGEVAGFVGIAFAATGAASQAKRDIVFGEDIGKALDFASVGDGEEDAFAFGVELLHFFQHGGNCAMEARRGLGEE